MKTALITGAFGQDGYFLTKKLFELGGYRIICTSHAIKPNLDVVYKNKKVEIEILDIRNEWGVNNIIKKYKPDEMYHLAGFSAPVLSWENPRDVINTNGDSTILLLEAIRLFSPKTKFFYSSSAKIFGEPVESPQTEETPVNPLDPYSLGKYIGHQAVKLYRAKYGIFAVNGILYNHESHLKNINFVTYKICHYAQKLKSKEISSFSLLNTEAEIDLGDPRDYVNAMQLVLQEPIAGDYIISMNNSITIRSICEKVSDILKLTNILSHIEVKSKNINKNIKFKGKNDKLKSIGWKSQFELNDTLKLILNKEKTNFP